MRHISAHASRHPGRGKARSRPGVTSLDKLPIFLDIGDMAALYRLGESTIRKRLKLGVFQPLPVDRKPFRWNRDDVEAYLRESQTTALRLDREHLRRQVSNTAPQEDGAR